MRLIFVLSLLIVAVCCYPYPDRWEVSDDFDDGEWGPYEGPRQRRPSRRFFGDDDDDSDSDERRQNPLNDVLKKLLEKYLKDLVNGTKLDSLPPNYHNESSIKEIVNGSLVTINETIDKETDQDNNTFTLDVKSIDVQPLNATDKPQEELPSTALPSTELPATVATTKLPEMTTEVPLDSTTAGSKVDTSSTAATIDDLLNELTRSTSN
ncbi:hypothetical protein CHUAL_007728 [Chamberlinius hualienensis]